MELLLVGKYTRKGIGPLSPDPVRTRDRQSARAQKTKRLHVFRVPCLLYHSEHHDTMPSAAGGSRTLHWVSRATEMSAFTTVGMSLQLYVETVTCDATAVTLECVVDSFPIATAAAWRKSRSFSERFSLRNIDPYKCPVRDEKVYA